MVEGDLMATLPQCPRCGEWYSGLCTLCRSADLEVALRNLVAKLDAVAPEIEKVTMLAWAHGNRYTGPNYKEELKIARELLS